MLALAAAFVPAGAHAAQEGIKIATVDVQRALQTVEAGKKARATLEKEFNAKKASLQAEEASFKKAAEDFKNKSLLMVDEARNKSQAELQERYMKLQELTARSQQEIQAKERELTEPLIAQIKDVIREVSKTKGYTIVLEKNENSVLVAPDQDDLTAPVVEAFNKKNKG